jgi:hypothetical protein
MGSAKCRYNGRANLATYNYIDAEGIHSLYAQSVGNPEVLIKISQHIAEALACIAAPLNTLFRSWLWLWLRPRGAASLLERDLLAAGGFPSPLIYRTCPFPFRQTSPQAHRSRPR